MGVDTHGQKTGWVTRLASRGGGHKAAQRSWQRADQAIARRCAAMAQSSPTAGQFRLTPSGVRWIARQDPSGAGEEGSAIQELVSATGGRVELEASVSSSNQNAMGPVWAARGSLR